MAVACNDDPDGGRLQAQVSFAATAGTTYQIQIGGYNQDFGNLVVSFTPTGPGAAPARAASAAAAPKPAPPRDPLPLEAE